MFVVVASPLIFATLARYTYAGRPAEALLVGAVAAGVMGIWSSTTASGAGALQTQRYYGVLELLVGSPTPFWAVVLPISVAISGIGVYSLLVGLVYVRVVYGVPIHVHDWPAFLVGVPATIGSIGALGFVLASALVRYRSAFMIGNVFEWPVWTICGLLIPVATLPAWLRPVSWALAPTWGMRALRDATLGQPGAWTAVGVAAALAALYLCLGAALLRVFVRAARQHATLSLV
jgi:ABC-2 type transport system permease protein